MTLLVPLYTDTFDFHQQSKGNKLKGLQGAQQCVPILVKTEVRNGLNPQQMMAQPKKSFRALPPEILANEPTQPQECTLA